MADPNSAVILQ